MWDYSFAVPSLLIITIILVFYFSLPRLSVRMNRNFVNLLIVESAVIFFDIIASWGDENYTRVSVGVLYLLNGMYFALFFYRAYVFFAFTANIFRVKPIEHKVKAFISRVPFVVAILITISSVWTGLIFSIDGEGYHSGPLYNLVYYVPWFYIAATFYLIIVFRKNISRKRFYYCIILANCSIMVGIIIRKMLPHLLLMDTFCLISILVIYLAFQNPEFYLDLRGSIFNSTALRDYIDEHNGMLSHRLVGVVVHRYNDMRDIYGSRQIDAGITLISTYLTTTFTDYNVFYYGRGRFVILGSKSMPIDEVIATINDRFRKPWVEEEIELYLEPGYVTYDMNESVVSSDSFENALMYAMEQADLKDDTEPVVITDEALGITETENSLKRYLETAVDADKVEVFLQPIVDAKTEKLVGAEALSRIRDSEGKLISPGIFIPIAEKNGRINILGEQVFEKTCRFVKENDIKKMGMLWINVNLSPMQFMKADLADRYDAIVKKYGIDPDQIHLEITEESMIDDIFLKKQIQSLQGKGFIFVLDDYGTGYSNLTRLKQCPFINVKLDMSLVNDFYRQPDEILPNMIEAFKHMGFDVTAEGIENEQMAEIMRNIGCDYLQGYNYSKPIPMEEFLKKYG